MNTNAMTKAALLLLFAAAQGLAAHRAMACTNAYFSAEDSEHRTPLAKPSRELLADLKAAGQGNVVAQRNLGIGYEVGYLVSPCREKAIAWYAKAATGGDEPARKALERLQQRAALQSGPECLGSQCTQTDGHAAVSLQARGNHFYAPVSVNGRTIEGVIDTGASLVSMSADTARLFGIDFSGGSRGKSLTANGVTEVKVVTVPSLSVAGIAVPNVQVSVGDSKHPILIGMAFLKYVRTNIEGGTLTLSR